MQSTTFKCLIFLFLQHRPKGVEHLIQVENPNRIGKKTKKVSELDNATVDVKPQLSRRER